MDILLDGQNQNNVEELFKGKISSKRLEIGPKRKTFYVFNGDVYEIWISKKYSSEMIKQQVLSAV